MAGLDGSAERQREVIRMEGKKEEVPWLCECTDAYQIYIFLIIIFYFF